MAAPDEVHLGDYMWNWRTGEFHSTKQGRSRIIAWFDSAGGVYEPDELDDDVEPTLATVELLEGEHAGYFVNVDVAKDDDDPSIH